MTRRCVNPLPLYSTNIKQQYAHPIQTGELLDNIEVHEDGMQVTDLQMSSDRTYFITASKDKTAKVRQTPHGHQPKTKKPTRN